MTDFSAFAARLAGFDWDRGNAEKNWARHAVSRNEAEEVFFHEPVLLAEDAKHSTREPRYLVLGRTAADRRLAVIFTVRRDLVRVIYAQAVQRADDPLVIKNPEHADVEVASLRRELVWGFGLEGDGHLGQHRQRVRLQKGRSGRDGPGSRGPPTGRPRVGGARM